MHGGQLLARALRAEGVDTIFALTGGHILPILDGCMLEGIKVVDVRHEQTAIHAAEAYARLTGRLGVAAVTAGPGVTDAITGVANAHYSATPVLLLGGRHYIRQETMGGLQEMDHPRLFGSITAWAGTAWETAKLPSYVATAARHAFAGRGGPVFLDVPLDVQGDMVSEDAIDWPSDYRPAAPRSAPDVAVQQIVDVLAGSERPMIVAGGGYRLDRERHLVTVAEALDAPVYLQSSARGTVPFGHALLGNRTRSQAFAEADVVLALGVDWDFRTGYGRKIAATATVVHVDLDATKIGWNRPAHVGVVADPVAVMAQLADAAERFASSARSYTADLTSAERAAAQAADQSADDSGSPVMPDRFAREVAGFFGPDAIVAVDGGDIVSTTARWLQTSHPGFVLDPGPFGTLGTGPGYALAAQVIYPDTRVGIVFGDGGFGFNGMEFDTYIRHDLPIIGVLGNDGAWSNIKTLHKMFYPDRVVAADLGVRPYHAMVEGLGGHGSFVETSEDLGPALQKAADAGIAALVNVHLAETVRASSNYSQ